MISKCLKRKPIGGKKLSLCIVLLITKAVLLLWVLGSTLPLATQILDILGVPSTVYMGDVSCNHCNSFKPAFIIEPHPESASLRQILLLNIVSSHLDNIKQRQAIRQTWGSVRDYDGNQIRTYFFVGVRRSGLGTTARDNTYVQLHNESSTYQDIVQVNIAEDYHALTNKTIAGLLWATSRYPDARFILKTDDDSFNVIQRFSDYLLSARQTNFVGGMCSSGERPHRNPKHQWYVPKDVYSSGIYPVHAKGRAYVLSQDAARTVLSVSPNVRFNSMEDLFVTGLCRATAGLQCVHIPQIPNRNEEITDCDVALFVFNVHKVKSESMMRLWNISRNTTARQLCSSS